MASTGISVDGRNNPSVVLVSHRPPTSQHWHNDQDLYKDEKMMHQSELASLSGEDDDSTSSEIEGLKDTASRNNHSSPFRPTPKAFSSGASVTSVASAASTISRISNCTGISVSSRKMLTDFIAADPTNRECADCGCLLVDFTKMYVSFYYNKHGIRPKSAQGEPGRRRNMFLQCHRAFSPFNILEHSDSIARNSSADASAVPKIPTSDSKEEVISLPFSKTESQYSRNTQQSLFSIQQKGQQNYEILRGYRVDETNALNSIAHGVFICHQCSIAHKSINQKPSSVVRPNSLSSTVVKSVTSDQFERAEVDAIFHGGGNARNKHLLERFISPFWQQKRPTNNSSLESREIFIAAKYLALAFVFPSSPLTVPSPLNALMRPNAPKDIGNKLPNRLVDYFCIVSPSGYLERNLRKSSGFPDYSQFTSPEEISFETRVTECFPTPKSYNDGKGKSTASSFPSHLAKFVFPEGCKPRKSQTPSLFTFTLTNELGRKMYGAAMHIYDIHVDMSMITNSLEASGYEGDLPPFIELWKAKRAARNNNSRNINKTFSGDVSTLSTKSSKSTLTRSRSNSSDAASDLYFLPKSIVILSHHGFFDVFRKFLLQIYHVSIVKAPLPLERYIANLVCEIPLPPVGKVAIKKTLNEETLTISRPPSNRMPLFNCSYRPLFTCLSASNIVTVLGCILQENRIALCSKHYALLGPCCEALLSFLFPLTWQGVYIPIVPAAMVEDLLEAPVPFVVGLTGDYLAQVPVEERPKGVVIVDLDEDIVHLGYEDGRMDYIKPGRLPPVLPEKDASKLRAQLEQFGGMEFVAPSCERKGRITYCDEEIVLDSERSPYSRMAYAELTRSRPEYLRSAEDAFVDHEDLMPINFTAGTMTGGGDSNGVDWAVKGMKDGRTFRMGRKRMLGEERKTTAEKKSEKAESTINSSHILNIESPYEDFDVIEIRNSCLRFMVSLFQDYEKYISQLDGQRSFLKKRFKASYKETKPFLVGLVDSQMFERFIEEKMTTPNPDHIKFFDDSIIAKKNRSKATVGRKRETKFISGNSGRIVETFIPPEPNNQGITTTIYHYQNFPDCLDFTLFGTIRRPKRLEHTTSRRRRRLAAKKASVQQSANTKQKFISDLLKPYPSTMTPQKKDLNWAIHVVAYQNARDGEIARYNTNFFSEESDDNSDASEEFIMPPDFVERARIIIDNARIQQLLHIINIMNFQRYWLRHLAPIDSPSRRRHFLLTPPPEKNRWSKIKASITFIQSHFRRKRARTLFEATIVFVTKIQTMTRGYLTRKRIHKEVQKRLTGYRKQIVALWERARTPLFYRSRFWVLNNLTRFRKLPMHGQTPKGPKLPKLHSVTKFLSLALQETELGDLHETLGIRRSKWYGDEDSFLVQSPIYITFLGVRALLDVDSGNPKLFPAEKTTEDGIGANLSVLSQRIDLERVQVYERLSNFKDQEEIFNMMNLLDKDKTKKTSVAKTIWTKSVDASTSASVVHTIFPELLTAANVSMTMPSKKGLSRMGIALKSKELIPPPMDRPLQLEAKLDKLVRLDLGTVTKGLIKVSFNLDTHDISLKRPEHWDRPMKVSIEEVRKFIFHGALV